MRNEMHRSVSVTRVTVRLPDDLLDALDSRLARGRETRSSVIRRLVEMALRDIDEADEREQYMRAYREQPQTGEEFGWSDQVTMDAFEELPKA